MNRKPLFLLFACASLAAPAAWAQARNPVARPDDPALLLPGAWNGADLEKRSNCAATQNNGTRGTYAEYDIGYDRTAATIGINQIGITGLQCTYSGAYTADRFQPTWTGFYSCTDGKTGNFQAQSISATANAMSIRLSIKLTGSETCDIDAILGGSRF
ncbi:MAG TPA: hypothetical protein VH040_02905 [Usitatibacter sp.]|jgi:hypothetical protein|nr:hypothetical protein [Usitatibacter sp.]